MSISTSTSRFPALLQVSEVPDQGDRISGVLTQDPDPDLRLEDGVAVGDANDIRLEALQLLCLNRCSTTYR
jgi:hypothetical protein